MLTHETTQLRYYPNWPWVLDHLLAPPLSAFHDGHLPASDCASKRCLSESQGFLSSQAWCLHEKCADVPAWDLENWWDYYVVGNLQPDPRPSLTYGAALALVPSLPNYTCSGGKI